MTRRRQALGRSGEDLAARFYESHGYTVLDRNWRVREGELDLVCHRADEIVFVEVKTRSSARYGTGAEAVTPVKQARIRRLAMLWLKQHPNRNRSVRFDVIDIDGAGRIKPYKNAF